MSHQQAGDIQSPLRNIVNDPKLSFIQKARYLSLQADSMLEYPELPAQVKAALESRLICDMFEGHAPFKPRYVLPDYQTALKNGSEYLELPAPQDLDEAINFLLILFNHVPSVTGMPVFIGRIDQLLEPFADESISDEQLHKKIRLMWQMIDRTLPDAFLHTNIGPEDSRVARAVLAVDRELKQVAPNLTLRYDPAITPDSLLLQAIENITICNKPHIANDAMNVADYKALGDFRDYGVVSCYNTLPMAGGAHSLVRVDLKKAAEASDGTVEGFLNKTLPEVCEWTYQILQARINYLVNESNFYQSSFLVHEGLIDPKRFTAMFGMFGMAEAVNHLLNLDTAEGYGHSKEAQALSLRISEKLAEIVESTPLEHCWHNRAMLHAQSGINMDVETSPGCRIPYGHEPSNLEHILAVLPHHKLYVAGISDIFPVDETVKNNPQALMAICKGSLQQGLRIFTCDMANNELIRVTGYMVRRSDIQKHKEEGSRLDTSVLGAGAAENCGILNRNARTISNENIVWGSDLS
ncbi:YjjI family glycine radical enzyme [Parendozoicomonas haliclonae]|uniref:YjjI family glycine radical enzyme n=1 Tax=Parendozoicomonas haliclonae TaxID=1960125 RepID=A0A1X7AIC6_9GAMM|nr:YjjI family glycine radical enzyme [Parendozoicomonas haliclonae]SMA44973.1 hypothetical protein EHSB41UT_01826 [Parendozoicomonas haliclonae]